MCLRYSHNSNIPEAPMTTIAIPDETYQRLAALATARNLTPDALATAALDQLAQQAPTDRRAATTPVKLSDDEWKAQFDALTQLIRSRSDRYPPGFKLDVSREAMYEGCGE